MDLPYLVVKVVEVCVGTGLGRISEGSTESVSNGGDGVRARGTMADLVYGRTMAANGTFCRANLEFINEVFVSGFNFILLILKTVAPIGTGWYAPGFDW